MPAHTAEIRRLRARDSKAKLVVCADASGLFTEAAQLFVAIARDAITARGRFMVALSGGSTPKALYELLATSAWAQQVDWANVWVFLGDERYVPPTHKDSNYRMAHEALLSKVPVSPDHVLRVRTEITEANTAAADYERKLREVLGASVAVPQFDLVLLGLGTNGHTASLFPHTRSLHESSRLVFAEHIEEISATRITMTAPVLNAAREVVFLVSGRDKAGVVNEVVCGARDPERLPAQLVQPSGRLTWLLDEAAASELSCAEPSRCEPLK
jgi:6-phosphogluconolactonase